MMAVEVNFDRKAVEITWDASLVGGRLVDIKTTNGDDSSGRTGVANDGRATLTYPSDFKGTTQVTVTGEDGGEDSGTIEIK
jgi:hypothetical protein